MQELQIVLDKESGKHLYEQIYLFLRESIRQGTLREGERLPPTRLLAVNLGVSRSTVQLAYEQLLSEGYIQGRRGSGYYVHKLEGITDLPLREEANQSKDVGETESEESFPVRVDFSPRFIEMKQFPHATWKKIHKGIFAEAKADLFSTGEAAGDFALRQTIARYLRLSRGVHCEPSQVVIGAGTDYLLLLLGQIMGEICRIGMESPTYLRAGRIFGSMGWEVRGIPMDAQGMRADYLAEEGCSMAYVMPAHQYPVGTLMPVARRMQLLRWASEDPGRWLIEDDYDSEFRYRGKPVPSLQSLDRSGKVIYIGTFSKSIAPAIRISYMILPPALLRRYRERCYFFSNTVSRIDQAILQRFMEEGFFERYLNRMRTLYRSRHDVLVQQLRTLGPQFAVTGTGAGLHVMLWETGYTRSTVEKREEQLQELALQKGVKVYRAGEFRLVEDPFPKGQKVLPGIVLGYGGLSEEEIREGVSILRSAWMP